MKKKILVMLLAMLATISNACKVGEIQLNGSNACVIDCGKYWDNSKTSFRNCTINQLGTPATGYYDYYQKLPADTPQKRFANDLDKKLKDYWKNPSTKKKSPQRKRN